MLNSANNPGASLSPPPSSRRKERRGRGSGGGGNVSDSTSTTFLALVTTILPSLVAGQSMACRPSGSYPQYVQQSDAMLAFMNSIVPDGVTFNQVGAGAFLCVDGDGVWQ